MQTDQLEVSDIECDIDEDVDQQEREAAGMGNGKAINDSFINKLRDISSFKPSGIKAKDKGNSSMMVMPVSSIDLRMKHRNSNLSHIQNDSKGEEKGFSSMREHVNRQSKMYDSPLNQGFR